MQIPPAILEKFALSCAIILSLLAIAIAASVPVFSLGIDPVYQGF